jgi:hypothetical protein
MQSTGEDKKIRVLFHELKLEDSRTRSSFTKTWNNAEAKFKSARFKRRSLEFSSLLRVSAAVVVCLALVAVALLLKHLRLRQLPKHEAVQQGATAPKTISEAPSPPQNAVEVSGNTKFHRPNSSRVAGHKLVRSKGRNQIASAPRSDRSRESTLSHWQSPTATLMRSASDSFLRVGPQLNESTQEMKKFLVNSLN